MWVLSGSICKISAWPNTGAAARIKPMSSRFVRILFLQFGSDSEHSGAERRPHGHELQGARFADMQREHAGEQFGALRKSPNRALTHARSLAERQHESGHACRTP